MPHVIIEGDLSAARAHREIFPFEERRDGVVLRVRESFLSRQGQLALVEAVVVEGVTRRFLVALSDQDRGLSVRLYPLTDPEKTAGVKLLLARVARRVLALDPGARVVRTNLEPELGAAAEVAP